MPSRAELLDYYATESGRDTDEIDYYVILARFKLAVVLEAGYARVVAGNGRQSEDGGVRRRGAEPGRAGGGPRLDHVTSLMVPTSVDPEEANRFDLTGKVALVTGGSRGLGRSMALGFAAAGADVVVASRKLDACRAVAAEIEAMGRRALAWSCNVSNWDELEPLADAAYDAFGRVDVLVNNAGMSLLYTDVTEVTEAMWDKVVNLNLKGVFRLTALVGSRMVRDGGGSIINVSSVGSIRPTPEILPYAAAKAGVNSLTAGFARAFGPDRARQLHHGGAVPHRRHQGLGHGGLRARRAAPRPATLRRPRRSGRHGAVLRQRRLELHHRTAPARRRRHSLSQPVP